MTKREPPKTKSTFTMKQLIKSLLRVSLLPQIEVIGTKTGFKTSLKNFVPRD